MGLLGERSNERRRAHLAPPVLYATALLLDSTGQADPTRIASFGGLLSMPFQPEGRHSLTQKSGSGRAYIDNIST